MFSTLGQPNWFGAYLAITFFISIFLFFSSSRKKSTLIALLGILFSYAGILLSRSRSSLVSIVPGVIVIGIYYLFLLIKKKNWLSVFKQRAMAMGIGGLFFLTIVCQTGIPQLDSILTGSFFQKSGSKNIITPPSTPVEPSLIYVGGVTESLDIRKIVWKGAWELGMQYPLFGTGVETFGYAYYSVRPQSHNMTSEWDYLYNKAHNEYLNLLATTGWFGLGTFLVLLVWVSYVFFIRLGKSKNDSSTVLFYLTLIGMAGSIIITNFFGFSISVINIYWYLMIAWLAVYDEPTTSKVDAKNRVGISKVGIAIVVTLWLLNGVYTYWLADYKYAQSEIAIKSNNSGVAVNLLQEALTLREEHVYQDKLSYALAQYAFVASYQKEKEKSQQVIEASENLNLKSIQSSSQNVLYWKTRVKNQFIFYQMSLDK
ncbi:MAG: O-antigen ligase family protein, partial [Ignavibacteriaceae bacterium]|nr:O-antigen ligase family protein [Ignavibacteriaceae bacterium]